VDAVLGLLHLREFQPLRIYSTVAVRRVLTEENGLFRTLARSTPPVQWEALPLDRQVPIFEKTASEAMADVFCRAVPLDGSFPDYVSDGLRKNLPEQEAVIGLELVQGGKRLFYAPTLPGRGNIWKRQVAQSDVALLDGTFWTDDELVAIRGSGKTAREMGHLPLSGENGLLDQLQNVPNTRRVLLHLNNTNPLLDEESAASRAVHDAGWEVAYDGMEIEV
jgi:pyrroloquinoline quinone biosynthesis protein B